MLRRLWYWATGSIPKRLPRNTKEFAAFKYALIHGFGIPDEPQSWVCVGGEVGSIAGNRTKARWDLIANKVKRIPVNQIARACLQGALQELNQKLEAAVAREVERTQNEQQASEVQPQENADPLPQAEESPTPGNSVEGVHEAAPVVGLGDEGSTDSDPTQGQTGNA